MNSFTVCVLAACAAMAQSGPFPEQADVGSVGQKGSTAWDAGTKTYRLTGTGANIWANEDGFHYAYKQTAGDVAISAVVEWAAAGGNAHKKAGPMLRTALEGDAPHASVMVHSDGLIALQYRRVKGGPTEEVRTAVKAPARVKLTRNGDVISFEAGKVDGPLQPGGALTVVLPERVYAGLAACSHDNGNVQTAVLRGVELEEDGVAAAKERVVESTLETVDIRTGERRVVYRAVQHFEAPNWTPDGAALVFNSGGKIYRIPAAGGVPQLIPTGDVRCNNDHGISADGQWLAISGSVGRGQSQVYIVPMAGGEPRLLTPKMPSYWHGWSPDGKTVAYCASRDGEYDVYTMPAAGGAETRLTTAKGLDDGPEYSPDGTMIYFNSVRSGVMRIWGMKADGTEQRMISQGPEAADWFAHFSPDGQWITYISYDKSVEGHPANKDVVLNLAKADGSAPRRLVTLFGGQGTMNVPNWAPDSTRFAFVSYRLVGKK